MTKRRWILLAALLTMLALLSLVSLQAQTFGSAWTGQFYNTTTFSGPLAAIASYPNGLNFTWPGQPTDGSGIILAGVNPDNFSARFATSANFAQAGTYQFFGVADDQIQVYLDSTAVYSSMLPGQFNFQYSVPVGVHTLRIDLVELVGNAIIQFQWQLAGGGTPTAPAPSQVIGMVVNVQGLSLRSGPYLGASFLGVLRPSTAYPVLGKNTDEGGGYTWYLVRAGEQTGWASGRYFIISADVPIVRSTFEDIDNAPDVGVVAVPRANMNLRRRPSARSARIGNIPWGAEVTLVGRTIQGGQHFWFQVRYNGLVGWIYAPYVGYRGNIDLVPVR